MAAQFLMGYVSAQRKFRGSIIISISILGVVGLCIQLAPAIKTAIFLRRRGSQVERRPLDSLSIDDGPHVHGLRHGRHAVCPVFALAGRGVFFLARCGPGHKEGKQKDVYKLFHTHVKLEYNAAS